MRINMQKLEQYVKEEKIMEFDSDKECLEYFNTYDYQDFASVEEMKAYQGQYGFNIGEKRYHVNYEEALDVWEKEEKTMSLIDIFAEKALSIDGSFDITIKEGKRDITNYHFLQGNVGKAKYVYGAKTWNNENFAANMDLKPALVAIIAEDIIYVVDDFFLQTYNYGGQKENILPSCVKNFYDYAKEQNTYASEVVFAKFYEDLDAMEIADEDTMDDCKDTARTFLLSKNPVTPYEEAVPENMLKENDVAKILCGLIDAESEVLRRLEDKKESWIKLKSKTQKIISLIKEGCVVEDWELKIIEGLRGVDAKTVTVEFEFNGIKDSGKMTPEIIIRTLREKSYFSGYNFETTKRGDEIIANLGAGHWWGDNPLRCNHIVRITYGKKVLYDTVKIQNK